MLGSTKLTQIAAAVVLLLASGSVFAAPFFLDLNAVPGGIGGRVDGETQVADELEIIIQNNVVNVTFDNPGAIGIGDTFTFTDTGTIQVTGFIPPNLPENDDKLEGFNQDFQIIGSFDLTGSGSIIDLNGTIAVFEFDFNPGGDVELIYDEFGGGANVQILDGTSIDGSGVVQVNLTGGAVQQQTAAGFVFNAIADDLLDGFFVQSNGQPFTDGFTFAFTDGNVNNTVTTVNPDGTLTISADTNGSVAFEVPEPASIALLSFGLIIGGATLRRRLS